LGLSQWCAAKGQEIWMLVRLKSGRAFAALVCIGVGTMTVGASTETATPDAAPPAITASPSDQVPTDVQEETVSEPASTAPGEKLSTPPPQAEEKPGSETAASTPLDEVKEYLWRVYQRSSTKTDSHGDFTWKDATAADLWGLSTQDYVIGGMDPDFREQLFAVGHAMDEAGIAWTILSAFRDDFRQSLAVGFKARGGNSFHGGSTATGGYGHGCAVDLASTDGLSDDKVWNWLDLHGEPFGLRRPLRGRDPAHVQPIAGWHELAATLRDRRLGTHPQPEPTTAGDGPEDSAPQVADSAPDDGLSEQQIGCMRARTVEAANQRGEGARRLSLVAHWSARKHGAKSKAKTASSAAVSVKSRHASLRRAPAGSRVKGKGRSHLAGRDASAGNPVS
jgi:hypothetical protein